MGKYDISEEYLLKYLYKRERILPSDHIDIANFYNKLGLLYNYIGNYDISEEYFLKCIHIRERILP